MSLCRQIVCSKLSLICSEEGLIHYLDGQSDVFILCIQFECTTVLSMTLLNAVFGVDLTTIVKMEGGLIPSILSRCIEELQSRGVNNKYFNRLVVDRAFPVEHVWYTCDCNFTEGAYTRNLQYHIHVHVHTLHRIESGLHIHEVSPVANRPGTICMYYAL